MAKPPRYNEKRSEKRSEKRARPAFASKTPIDPAYKLDARALGITPELVPANAITLIRKLQRNGFEAYLVGGCIRDLLMKKSPKDWDIATNARPEQISQIFGRQCRLIGRRFRLAHILFGRELYEVATFRAAHSSQNSDKQAKTSEDGLILRDNVYGNLLEDAERRDFSVNAIYYDPESDTLLDFYQGYQDIQAGKLRLIGTPALRYQEDPVRILRALRFMAKLDMFLETETKAAIRANTPLLAQIPAARLFEESLKLLQAGNGVTTFALLQEYDVLQYLFPVLDRALKEGDQRSQKLVQIALQSTDERVRDGLRLNPVFLFATFLWYPLREKMEQLKNEGGLNSSDAMALAASELLTESNRAVALSHRHRGVIREIWTLQLLLTKRSEKRAQAALEQPKFRAGFDLLVMRAEVEGGDLIELSQWWHEYQLSNEGQRQDLVKNTKPRFQNASETDAEKPRAKRRRKPYRRRKAPRHNGEA